MPTAARSRVGTSVIAASGRPASRRPCTRQLWIARQDLKLSEPPRRITALPDFRHSTPASAATLGRLSKITAMTPSGTRTRSIVMPLGRCQLSVTLPTGSAIPRTVATPLAISSIRAGVSVSRSMKAEVAPPARTSATSSALAARIAGAWLRIARAIASSARFFCSGEASASTRAAARARAASSVIKAGKSALPSIAFSGTVIAVSGSSLRPCASTEIPHLRGAEPAWLAGGKGPGRSANGLFRRYSPRGPHHQIVAVDHLGPAADAQNGHHVRRGAAFDLFGVLGVIGDEAAADFMGVGAAHHHGVAAGELALDPDHAGRQQALSGAQGGDRAGVDGQGALRLQ